MITIAWFLRRHAVFSKARRHLYMQFVFPSSLVDKKVKTFCKYTIQNQALPKGGKVNCDLSVLKVQAVRWSSLHYETYRNWPPTCFAKPLQDGVVVVSCTPGRKNGWHKCRGPKQNRRAEKVEWPQPAWTTENIAKPAKCIRRCHSTFVQWDNPCPSHSLLLHDNFQDMSHHSISIFCRPGRKTYCCNKVLLNSPAVL